MPRSTSSLRVTALLSSIVAALAFTPAARAATGPAQTSFPVAFAYSLIHGPNIDPPGANDFSCKPTAAHPRPIVLVHGTWENKYNNFAFLAPQLKRLGFCVFAPNYSQPLRLLPTLYGTGSVKASGAELGRYVDRVLAATGASKVDIVGHSQGGMMPRAYVKYFGGASKVGTIVSLAGSQGGLTLSGIGTLWRQLGIERGVASIAGQAIIDQLVDAPFIRALNEGGQTVKGIRYVNIATRYDVVVTPYTNSYITKNPAGADVENIGLQFGCPANVADHLSISYGTRTLYFVAKALGARVAARPPCNVQLPIF